MKIRYIFFIFLLSPLALFASKGFRTTHNDSFDNSPKPLPRDKVNHHVDKKIANSSTIKAKAWVFEGNPFDVMNIASISSVKAVANVRAGKQTLVAKAGVHEGFFFRERSPHNLSNQAYVKAYAQAAVGEDEINSNLSTPLDSHIQKNEKAPLAKAEINPETTTLLAKAEVHQGVIPKIIAKAEVNSEKVSIKIATADVNQANSPTIFAKANVYPEKESSTLTKVVINKENTSHPFASAEVNQGKIKEEFTVLETIIETSKAKSPQEILVAIPEVTVSQETSKKDQIVAPHQIEKEPKEEQPEKVAIQSKSPELKSIMQHILPLEEYFTSNSSEKVTPPDLLQEVQTLLSPTLQNPQEFNAIAQQEHVISQQQGEMDNLETPTEQIHQEYFASAQTHEDSITSDAYTDRILGGPDKILEGPGQPSYPSGEAELRHLEMEEEYLRNVGPVSPSLFTGDAVYDAANPVFIDARAAAADDIYFEENLNQLSAETYAAETTNSEVQFSSPFNSCIKALQVGACQIAPVPPLVLPSLQSCYECSPNGHVDAYGFKVSDKVDNPCASVRTNPETITRITMINAQMLRRDYRLFWTRARGLNKSSIDHIFLAYEHYHARTIGEARKLLVKIVQSYLAAINESGSHPQLAHHPFGPSDLTIKIRFDNFHGEYVDRQYVQWVTMSNCLVTYQAFNCWRSEYCFVRHEYYGQSEFFVELDKADEALTKKEELFRELDLGPMTGNQNLR